MSAGALTGMRCLVTGATGALGHAIASQLRREGADLLLAGRSQKRLQELIDALGAGIPGDGRLDVVAVDLTAVDAIAVIAAAVAAKSHLDVLINNAAVLGPIGPIWENDWDAWTEAIRIDLMVPVALCRALVAPLARARRGKIINLSGGGATAPRPNFSAYAVAKAGLVRFTETFAHEVRDRNIDVNAIAPGNIVSAMTRAVVAAGARRSGDAEHASAQEALGDDSSAVLAKASALCAWLASRASDGITGRLLAAQWDPWPRLDAVAADLADSDVYTLRRIVPADRGKDWD